MPTSTTKKPAGEEHILKLFKFGMEFELFVLDKKGRIVPDADRLLARIKEKAPSVDIQKEAAKNIIELGTAPHSEIRNFMANIMKDFETLLYYADQEGLLLYPYGTYPGRFTPRMNEDLRYRVKQAVFGERRFAHAGRCVGLHCHFTLPWGVFDSDAKNIKSLTNSKNKQSLVNIFNLFVAMDPALTTFAQSSPFYQGQYLGKDSRLIVYRGGKRLNYPQGLYANHQVFGALQQYETTGTDLAYIIKRRFNEWDALIRSTKLADEVESKHDSILDSTWNPVKINAHGTMEQRGMDMNRPRINVAIALIIKYLGKAIQEKYVQVRPSDVGAIEPFKYTNDEILVPPHTVVRNHLQVKAAYEGLENDDVLQYCAALLRLARQFIPATRHSVLAPLDEMIKTRRTVSDQIVEEAVNMGIKLDQPMTDSQAAKLAVRMAKGNYQDLLSTRKALETMGE